MTTTPTRRKEETPSWFRKAFRPDSEKYFPTPREWAELTPKQAREYNLQVHEISTDHRIVRLPYVPSATRDLPAALYPIKP